MRRGSHTPAEDLSAELRATPPRLPDAALLRRAVRRYRGHYPGFLALVVLLPMYLAWRYEFSFLVALAFMAPPLAFACIAFVELNVGAIRALWTEGHVVMATVASVEHAQVTLQFGSEGAPRRVKLIVDEKRAPPRGADVPVLVRARSSVDAALVAGNELLTGRATGLRAGS
jgi:hypothetical protein